MKIFRNHISMALLLSFLSIGFGVCHCSADLNVAFLNGYRQDRISTHVEDLDTRNFQEAGFTTDWKSIKTLRFYQVGAYALWDNERYHLFGLAHARYGWTFDGTQVSYPLKWDIEGNATDLLISIGYVINVCDCFDFIPQIGFGYEALNYKQKHQRYTNESPACFANRNGDKTHTKAYLPFIAFDVRFKDNLCFCNDLVFLTGYRLLYGDGQSRLRVRRFVLTDDQDTSNYGGKVNYRNLVGHEFHLYGMYTFCENWVVSLGVEYSIFYNTHSNKVKYQHNEEIVSTGQFTPSQYHVEKLALYQSVAVNLTLGYNF